MKNLGFQTNMQNDRVMGSLNLTNNSFGIRSTATSGMNTDSIPSPSVRKNVVHHSLHLQSTPTGRETQTVSDAKQRGRYKFDIKMQMLNNMDCNQLALTRESIQDDYMETLSRRQGFLSQSFNTQTNQSKLQAATPKIEMPE